MKPPIDTIRVSQRSRDILVTLKRRTGIEHWNVLCRWAFCDSLANPTKPIALTRSEESNVEMSWQTFAGEMSEVLLALFAMRAESDEVPQEKGPLAQYFRSHLERGIAQLQSTKDLSALLARRN